MVEPGSAPPIPEGPVGGIYDGSKDEDNDAEMGSASFWNSLSEISVAGMTVTPDQARKIIYSIGAVLGLLVLALVWFLISDHGASDNPAKAGTDAAVPPPHSTAAFQFTAKLQEDGAETSGAQFIAQGSECSIASPMPSSTCGGTVDARCGITDDGYLYAWLGVTCVGDPQCEDAAASDGVPARLQPSTVLVGGRIDHGCSRAEDPRGTIFVSCCVAVPDVVNTTGICPAATPACGQDTALNGTGR